MHEYTTDRISLNFWYINIWNVASERLDTTCVFFSEKIISAINYHEAQHYEDIRGVFNRQ